MLPNDDSVGMYIIKCREPDVIQRTVLEMDVHRNRRMQALHQMVAPDGDNQEILERMIMV